MRNLEAFRAEYLWILGVWMENKPPFILLKPQWTFPNDFQPPGARDKMLDGALDSLLSHHLSLSKDRYAWNINYGLWTDSPLELLVHTSMVDWMLSDPCGNVWYARIKGLFPAPALQRLGPLRPRLGVVPKKPVPYLVHACVCYWWRSVQWSPRLAVNPWVLPGDFWPQESGADLQPVGSVEDHSVSGGKNASVKWQKDKLSSLRFCPWGDRDGSSYLRGCLMSFGDELWS